MAAEFARRGRGREDAEHARQRETSMRPEANVNFKSLLSDSDRSEILVNVSFFSH